jgi:hypothetical protein
MSNARDKANIPSLNFSSTGIDDNATSTAITINSSEQVEFTAGTVSLPSITTTGDTNTGIFFPLADTIAFTEGGAEAMRILNNGNVAIGRTTANFGGLGADHTVLTIGTTTGMGQLELAGFRSSDADLGRLIFGNKNVRLSEIVAIRTGADNSNALSFSTSSSGSNTERMRITSAGNVGIGTSSPATKLDINGGIKFVDTMSFSDSGATVSCFFQASTDIFQYGTSTSDPIVIYTNNTERMRIDATGNVGIGTSSPDSKVNIEATKTTALSTEADFLTMGLTIDDNTAYDNIGVGGGISFRGKRNAGGVQTVYGAIDAGKQSAAGDSYTGNLRFYTNQNSTGVPLERMRIDSSGNVKIAMQNFANAPSASNYGISFNNTNAGSYFFATGTTTSNHIAFGNPNGFIGSIQTNGSATLYNTSSDYRLKENVDYNFDATTRLKELKPARFNFIADADTTVDGFLAHEVQDIVPEAITGTKDATETKEKVVVNANGQVIAENIEQADWETGKIADENGNTQYPTDSTWEATKVVPVYQGIDQAKLVPLLVKTIQELEARITALETNQP